MKELWKKYKRIIIGTLVAKLTVGVVVFVWLAFSFGVKAYHAINAIPTLQDTVNTLQDTVASLDKAPIEINYKIKIIEKQQENISNDVEEIKDFQKQQIQTNQRMIELLLDIKNGD
jgi:TolA-binding protein